MTPFTEAERETAGKVLAAFDTLSASLAAFPKDALTIKTERRSCETCGHVHEAGAQCKCGCNDFKPQVAQIRQVATRLSTHIEAAAVEVARTRKLVEGWLREPMEGGK